MEHPVVYLSHATKFLDSLIQEHGDYLFVGLVFLCSLMIVWTLARRRKHPVHEIPVVILPLGPAPKRESELESPLFKEQMDDSR